MKKRKMQNISVKFFDWNILCRSYFKKETFVKCELKEFSKEERDKCIISKIEEAINGESIICLQEVDCTTWNNLIILFNQNVNFSFSKQN